MIKSVLFLSMTLFSTCALGLSPIELKEGLNRIDLNNNGSDDYVMASVYDRNMSYSNNALTFYIRLPNGELNIVPTADQNTFTWLDQRIFSGSITIRDNRLFQDGENVLLVVAKKHGENAGMFGPGLFTFEIYRFQEFSQHPGSPLHAWSLYQTVESAEPYVYSEQAYQEIDALVLAPDAR